MKIFQKLLIAIIAIISLTACTNPLTANKSTETERTTLLTGDCYSVSKDHEHVYFKEHEAEEIIESADTETFIQTPNNKHHFKDKNSYYIVTTGRECSAHIETYSNIDTETFEFLDYNRWYSKDKNHVYLHWEIIEKADPESYELLGDMYSKDKNYVFNREQIIKEADPETFEVLSYYYSKDKDKIYYYDQDNREIKVIKDADPESFTTLDNSESIKWVYAKDDSNFYRDYYIISESQIPDTVEKEEEEQSTPELQKSEDPYQTAHLFDSCPGLEAYKDKEFYDSMISTLQNANPPALTDRQQEEDQIIKDACYSEQLETVILLTTTSYEMGASFGVYNYDISFDYVENAIHQDTMPYPTEFGNRNGQFVELVNTVCASENSGDAPANCIEREIQYQYDLEKNLIID